ncbi:MAG: O-antigen ligase family protein [Pseudomonadota bacterium]|nr:O-antigen ligase family protein [Pseudomonadota bacterium]
MWLYKIRLLWFVGVSLFFLLNLDQFGFSVGLLPAPKYFAIGAFLGSLVLMSSKIKPQKILKSYLLFWILFYLTLSAVWWAFGVRSGYSDDAIMKVISTCLYIFTAWFIYSEARKFFDLWRIVLWVALVVGVASILQDFFSQGNSIFFDAGLGIAGRAGGLYRNPTIAAQTVVLILLCILCRELHWSNVIAAIVALVGVGLTFSRGGLLAYAVVLLIALWRKSMPRWFWRASLVVLVVAFVWSDWIFDLISSVIFLEDKNSMQRLGWIFGKAESNYIADDARTGVVFFGLEKFMQSPFFGGGLGSMFSWATGIGTHNLILRHLVDYGFVGAFIFPLFVYAGVRLDGSKKTDQWLWLSAGLVLMLSVFSHDMLEQACFIFPWMALCLMHPANKYKK